MCSIPILILFMFNDTIHLGALANLKELYFTPGLWDKQGVSFLRSFLFETPFALMRGLAWLFILEEKMIGINYYMVCYTGLACVFPLINSLFSCYSLHELQKI